MAGNVNSGNVLSFRMSEDALRSAIDRFRNEYGDGSKGMVTPVLCFPGLLYRGSAGVLLEGERWEECI